LKDLKRILKIVLIYFLDAPTFDVVLPSFNEMERNEIIQKAPLAAEAVTMVLHYAEENQKKPISHIRPLSFYQVPDFTGHRRSDEEKFRTDTIPL